MILNGVYYLDPVRFGINPQHQFSSTYHIHQKLLFNHTYSPFSFPCPFEIKINIVILQRMDREYVSITLYRKVDSGWNNNIIYGLRIMKILTWELFDLINIEECPYVFMLHLKISFFLLIKPQHKTTSDAFMSMVSY